MSLRGAHDVARAPPASAPSQRDISYDDLDKFKYYTIGPSCAFCCRFVLFPFSLVKTRLQMQKGDRALSEPHKVRPGLGTASATEVMRYTGTVDAFGKIVRHEGLRGLFKGFGVSCIGIGSGQLYITSYEIIRQEAKRLNDNHHVFSDASMDVVRNAVAGGAASLLSQTVVVPIDIVSQKQMMTSQERRPPSIIQLSRDIFAREGIAGFYRGFLASVMVSEESTRVVEFQISERELCGLRGAQTHTRAGRCMRRRLLSGGAAMGGSAASCTSSRAWPTWTSRSTMCRRPVERWRGSRPRL